METTIMDRLTISSMGKLNRYNYIATIFVALTFSCTLLWMIFRIQGELVTNIFSGIVYPFTTLIATCWAWHTAYRVRYSRIKKALRYQLAWLLIGLGLFLSCIGGLIYSIAQIGGQQSLLPGAVLFSNLYFPCVFAGLVLMPGTKPYRLSIIFDSIIITLCLLGIAWYIAIGPIYLAKVAVGVSLAKLLSFGIALAYPSGDIMLILALVLLVQQGVSPVIRSSFYLIGASFAAKILADTDYFYNYLQMGQSQASSVYIVPFWILGFLLMGLASCYQYTSFMQKAYHETEGQAEPLAASIEHIAFNYNRTPELGWRRIQSMFIFVPLTIMLVLEAFGETFHHTQASNGLAIMSVLAVAMVAVRQVLVTHENEAILQERDQKYQESERLRNMVTQLTSTLNLDDLRERIVSMLISEFGFTAAMFLLIEEYNNPLTHQPRLLVSTASLSMYATKWRLRGDNILYRTVMAKEKTEVTWNNHPTDTPAEVRLWQEKQHITSMTFFPIIYQDQVMGCLGVARHVLAYQEQSNLSTVEIYSKQIGTIIEHVYLYEAAREREDFARAMANIATRLNAAVVEPEEIGQLICKEGANVLHADYVLLYRAHEDGHLQPLAASVNEWEMASKVQEWPSLHISEYEALAVHSLQPVLLDVSTRAQPFPSARAMMQYHQKDPPGGAAGKGALPVGMRESYRQRALALHYKLARSSVQTAILAPLVAGGHLIGMLLLARSVPPGLSDKRPLDASDVPHAQDFAEQAGVAFANAQLYRHVRNAHTRLKELDQLKDQFMITASHELRTPLTAVQGYIELMAQYDEILPSEQRLEFLQKAQRGCEELTVMLGNVMDASRLEAEAGIRPELIKRVSVQEVIEKIIIMIEPQLTTEQRSLDFNIQPHLYIYADPVRLRQVLMNISVNALKYSPPGTPLGFAACAVLEQGHYVIISISDKGQGISTQDQAHIFQRFYRLERDLNSPVRGSGLGLYISRRLTEAMGGKVWIESKGVPGEGSTFHIRLPLAY